MLRFWVGFDRGLGSLIFKPVLFAVMPAAMKVPPSKSDLLRNSLLYQHAQAQRQEVLKHKWYESERAGHDVGFERALTGWLIKHRSEWLKRRRSETQQSRLSIP
jgi:hypothetical protein